LIESAFSEIVKQKHTGLTNQTQSQLRKYKLKTSFRIVQLRDNKS